MLNKLKDKILLSDELSKHLKLRKKGELFWGCCPFHKENTPSFVVNNEKKFFYCFGCGEHGDVFAFYVKHLNKPFAEALSELSQAYGVKVIGSIKKSHTQEYEKILDLALDHYRENLTNNPEALSYLQNRGITPQSIEDFKLGYANSSSVIDFLIYKGSKLEDIKKSGINSYGSLDRFRDRIIFPILSKTKKIIGFAGRVINEGEPKYINSSETELFQKSLHLFNEQNLEQKLPVILVEGYLDVISLTQIGIKNVVASMGTALSAGQVLTIFRNSDTLYLMFDGDQAGQIATERSVEVCLKVLTSDKKVFICTLAENQDPDTLAKKADKELFQSVLKNSQTLLQWKWECFLKDFKRTPESMAKIFENIESFLQVIQSISVRRAYKMFFDEEIFKLRKNLQTPSNPKNAVSSEEIVMQILIKQPTFLEHVIEDFMLCAFSNKIYIKIQEDIIEKITVNEMEVEELMNFIFSKYEKSLANLFTQNSLSYIIHNRGFALQYLKDTLCVLRRSGEGTLEEI